MNGFGGVGSQSHQRVISAALAVLGLALQSPIALSQDTSDPMEICFSTSDSTARLACFDAEMRRRHATTSPAVQSTRANSTTARTKTSDDTISHHSEAPQPMVVTLTRLIQRPGHQYSFELANGQVWESTDVEGDLFLGPHESVTIRGGAMGAFFLKTQSGVSIRVHRLR